MSAIFISHSSEDQAAAQEMMQHLRAENYEAVFLDFDGEQGIAAGRDWEAELYRNLSICRAVIVLLSEKWIASRWCFAELCLAKTLGKEIFPVRIAPCRGDALLGRLQIVDLNTEGDFGYGRLWNGLREAGLDPTDDFEVDRTRPPYPGFNYFEEKDAGIYFGRDADFKLVLDALTRMSNHREPPLAVVVGGSGSGKSSLVRAGVVPRLKKNSKSWIVVPAFRPGRNPVTRLAQALADSFVKEGKSRVAWEEIRDQILNGSETSGGKERHAAALLHLVSDLNITVCREDPNRVSATAVIVVDQFEELLLGGEKLPPGDVLAVSETDVFLELLRGLYKHSEGTVQVLATLRSDFFAAFLDCLRLGGNEFENLALAPMPNEAFFQVIEGPAARWGLKLTSALVNRMVADTGTDDALPLLAFTLREMWERSRRGMPWSVEVYDRQLGGIQGAIQQVVDEIRIDPSEEPDLRRAFLKLVRINEDEGFVRQAARWSELPESSQPLLRLFVEARLLFSDGAKVEVVHESLFRVWKKLAGWLADSREFLLWKKRTDAERRVWEKSGFPQAFLLKEGRLAEAERLMEKYGQDVTPELRDFVEKSSKQHEEDLRQERQRQQRELDAARELAETERQRAEVESKARRRQRYSIIALFGLLILVALAAVIAVWERHEALVERDNAEKANREASRQLGNVDWERGATTRNDANRVLLSAHFFLRAASFFQTAGEPALAKNAALAATLASRALIFTLPRGGPVRGALFTPDESGILAWNEPNGMALLWPLDQNVPMRGRPFVPVDGGVFNRDGSRILTWYRQAALLWATNQEKPIQSFSHGGGLDSADINGAVFNPDESRILTWSRDGTARLWTVGQKGAVQIFLHQGSVYGAVFNRDESRVLTWSIDGTAKLWALGQKEPVQIFLHQGAVYGAVFDRDESRVLTWSADGTAKLWALGQKEPVQIFLHQGAVYGAVFSQDASRILTWSKDGTAKLWVVGQKESIQTFEHSGEVSGAMFNRDESWILTWSAGWHRSTGAPFGDGTAKLWDQGPYKRNQTIGHKGEIVGATFDPAGTRILTLGSDGTARLWELDWNEPVGTFEHTGDVLGAKFTRDGSRILTWSIDGTVRLWAPNQNEPVQTFERRGGVEGAEFSRDGSRILTWSIDGTARLWASGESEPIRLFNEGCVAGAQFSLDCSRILTWSKDGIIRLWALHETEPIQTLNQTGEFSGAVLNSDGSRILTWSRDGMIRLWVVGRKEAVGSFQQSGRITGGVFNLDGSRILTWGSSGAWLWSSGNNSPIKISGQSQNDSEVRVAEFNRDGSRILTWSIDGSMRVWAVDQKDRRDSFKHHGGFDGAKFNRDGSQILTWGGGTVQLWALGQDEPIQTFEHDPHLRINGAEFNRDGSRILTWGEDKTARLWARDHKEPIQIFKHRSEVIRGIFNNDESRILTWSRNGPVQLWDISFDEKVPPDERIVELQVRSATKVLGSGEFRVLSFDEWMDAKRKLEAMRAKRQSQK